VHHYITVLKNAAMSGDGTIPHCFIWVENCLISSLSDSNEDLNFLFKASSKYTKKQVGLIAIVLKLLQFLYIVFRMLPARCMLVSKLTNYRAVWFPCGRTITYFKNGEMILKLDILFLITSTSTCRFGRKADFSLNNFENATIMEMSIRWMLSVEWIILTGQI